MTKRRRTLLQLGDTIMMNPQTTIRPQLPGDIIITMIVRRMSQSLSRHTIVTITIAMQQQVQIAHLSPT
jgi:hypothetical protein